MSFLKHYNPAAYGWSADRSQIIDFVWEGQSFPAGVHRLADPVFRAILNDMKAAGAFGPAGYNNPGDWGYEYRPVTNATSLSFHAFGLAIDIKAPSNPYVASGTAAHSIVDSLVKPIVAKYVSEWGGAWTSPHDYMHIEIHKTPDECRAFQAPTAPGGGSGRPTVRQGSTGSAVATVQRRLNLAPSVHPAFGPLTTSAVKMYQARHKITADGIVGPDTWSRLLTAKILPGERTCHALSMGPDVGWLQRRLNLTPAVHPAFGTKTLAAVVAWQRRVGLKADGVVGEQTWAKLLA